MSGTPNPYQNPGMPGQNQGPPPKNYLVQSILATIFCCWPIGIVAIIFAAQVNSKFSVGDYAGAVQASANAKKWTWITFGVGLTMNLIVMAFYAVAVIAAVSQQGQMSMPPGP